MGEFGSIYGTLQAIENEQGVPENSIFKFEEGLTLIQADAFKVKVADTTAAGDTFVGAFSSVYKTPSDSWKALQFATAASALAVTKEGAQDSAPCKADILNFLVKHTEEHGK
jgi:ribokinase